MVGGLQANNVVLTGTRFISNTGINVGGAKVATLTANGGSFEGNSPGGLFALSMQLTGTQLSARLRGAGASLPILIVSGYGGPGFELRATEAGVDRLLRKPYRKRELAEALAAMLGSR